MKPERERDEDLLPAFAPVPSDRPPRGVGPGTPRRPARAPRGGGHSDAPGPSPGRPTPRARTGRPAVVGRGVGRSVPGLPLDEGRVPAGPGNAGGNVKPLDRGIDGWHGRRIPRITHVFAWSLVAPAPRSFFSAWGLRVSLPEEKGWRGRAGGVVGAAPPPGDGGGRGGPAGSRDGRPRGAAQWEWSACTDRIRERTRWVCDWLCSRWLWRRPSSVPARPAPRRKATNFPDCGDCR